MLKKQLSLLAGIVIISSMSQSYASPVDPYEHFNRLMYKFNDFIDRAALKPVATLYNKIIPKPLNKGISNVYSNIDTVPTVINDALQGHFYQSVSDAWRITINSTVGIGGFFDVATKMGLEYNYEDLGLTFAQWGYKSSNYLVLPLIGPSTVRDGIAWAPNEFLTIYPYIKNSGTRYGIYAGGVIARRANSLHYQGVMDQAALDRYVFLRDAYLQNRNVKIQKNLGLRAFTAGTAGAENGYGQDVTAF